jgi:hypothetical protein
MRTLLLLILSCACACAQSITNSTVAIGPSQADGRSYIGETHRDSLGGIHRAEYLGTANDSTNIMSARAAELPAQLRLAEAARLLSTALATTPDWNSVSQLADAVRDRYRSAKGEEAARLARWIMDAYDAGRFTAAQLRTAFGMTTEQLIALQTRLNALRTQLNDVENATGE